MWLVNNHMLASCYSYGISKYEAVNLQEEKVSNKLVGHKLPLILLFYPLFFCLFKNLKNDLLKITKC